MTSIEENRPPDKYRTIKCSFKSIINGNNEFVANVTNKLFDATCRTNEIIIHTYQFLRLWILDKYHTNKTIPVITGDTIRMAFKCLIVKQTKGPKPKEVNQKMLDEFTSFYNDHYSSLNSKIIDGASLSQILVYSSVDMVTNIENNIKLNFINYVRRFVNLSFEKENKIIIARTASKNVELMKKKLSKELWEIKNDLINKTLLSNRKYHKWIIMHRKRIFPENLEHTYYEDINNNPQNYMKSMIYMCLKLEDNECKSFQFFPLRSDISPKYIPIDTKSIIEILVDSNISKTLGYNTYGELLKNITEVKHLVWSYFFDISKPMFKQKNYSFDYRITSDCFGTSIQLIHNDLVAKSMEMKLNKKSGRHDLAKFYKNLDFKDTKKIDSIHEKIKIMNATIKKNESVEIIREMREKFKKLSPADQKIIKNRKKNSECLYIEDLLSTQIEEIKKNDDWLVNDPGKKNLLYMKSSKGKIWRYSNRRHIKKTKRLEYQKRIDNHKKKNEITEIETQLSDHNSKTCKFIKFKEYIKKKNEINELLFEKYKEKKLVKYKWYAYINRQRAESELINEIKDIFGDTITIFYGDWSRKSQMKNFISTPNLKIKRKIMQHFNVYEIDEFRTSMLNHKTETKCENLYLPNGEGIKRKLHSVLTYTTENLRSGCINRDKNAVNNMVKIVNCYLEHGDRPEKFKRTYVFE